MSRIRSIKPDFWSSEQVMALSRDARLLFIGIWNFADDYGRMKFAPMTIKAQVLPGDDVSRSDMDKWLGEIVAVGLLNLYRDTPENSGILASHPEDSGIVYSFVPGWHHQRVSHPAPSKCPDPKGKSRVHINPPESSGVFANPPEHSRLIHSALIHLDPPREEGSAEGDAADAAPPAALVLEPVAKARPAKPRDEAKALFAATLKAEAKALGIPTPDVSGSVRDVVIRKAREHAALVAAEFPETLRSWLAGGLRSHLDTGKVAQWAIKDWAPYAARQASPARQPRLTPALGTTEVDFASAPSLADQRARAIAAAKKVQSP